MTKYVNLKTDWAFKKLMGQEPQMRSFLNSLLSEEYGEIKSLTFENVEVPSDGASYSTCSAPPRRTTKFWSRCKIIRNCFSKHAQITTFTR